MFSPEFTLLFNQIIQGNVQRLAKTDPAASDALGEKATALWNAEAARQADRDRALEAANQRIELLVRSIPSPATDAPVAG